MQKTRDRKTEGNQVSCPGHFSVPSLTVWQLLRAAEESLWSSSLCQRSPGACCSSSPSFCPCAPSRARPCPACPETWCVASLAGVAPGQNCNKREYDDGSIKSARIPLPCLNTWSSFINLSLAWQDWQFSVRTILILPSLNLELYNDSRLRTRCSFPTTQLHCECG